MKLTSILLCSSLLLLVAVDCKPVKRSDVPAVTAFEGIDKDNGGFKVGTTYAVTLKTGSGSGEDIEMPKTLHPPPPDFDAMFKMFFGKTPLEFLNSRRKEPKTTSPEEP